MWGGKDVEHWLNMKTEYITTDISYQRLAEKYGVSGSQIKRIGRQEGWVELRQQFRSKTVKKTLEKICESQEKQALKISALADKLLIGLDQAIEELVTADSPVDCKELRQLTAALKELKAIKGETEDDDGETGVVLLPPRKNAEC